MIKTTILGGVLPNKGPDIILRGVGGGGVGGLNAHNKEAPTITDMFRLCLFDAFSIPATNTATYARIRRRIINQEGGDAWALGFR